MEDGHLFVMIHGLWGGPHHVSSLSECLKHCLPQVHILRPKGILYFRTYDGVKLCGDVVIQEIFEEIRRLLQEKNIRINEISFVGYSLGGLIARYCVGELMRLDGFYDSITPRFFTTFATPHLGVKFFNNTLTHWLLNTLGSNLLGQTGKDLFDPNQILNRLTDPSQIYYKGLLKFKRRIIFSNVKNDRTVPFYTGFVTDLQLFNDWDSIKLKYLDDIPSISLSGRMVKPRVVDLQKCTRGHPVKKSYFTSDKIIRFGVIFLIVIFILPIWIPFVFIASSFGTIQSKIRTLFTPKYDIISQWKNANNHSTKDVDHPIEGEMAEFTENFVENVLEAEDQLFSESDVEDQPPKLTAHQSTLEIFKGIEYDVEYALDFIDKNADFFKENNFSELLQPADTLMTEYPLLKTPKNQIKMDDDRLEMIQDFNSLPIMRIPVFIDSFNAHDGIISRRGLKLTPRGLLTILLWCSLIKHSLDRE